LLIDLGASWPLLDRTMPFINTQLLKLCAIRASFFFPSPAKTDLRKDANIGTVHSAVAPSTVHGIGNGFPSEGQLKETAGPTKLRSFAKSDLFVFLPFFDAL
jgi:hypothetical protein